ncbi:hypothetical protein N7468_008621 [Penicillium chermesinum]|uniref:Uncharacterized protein n=1 Tax=Penicillium chermesinum TaxID=63820 RepID=A0A9W9NSY1_9EURO|nr:uncharacterized protein N7468_008621 [Penicillium chermesinum]KAJ5224079.1 hypothetical protein N7468_008621 [Penicillium chermesinum]KAJ6155105.1 hypothetical protein N7470_005671 [Penicillium chermesinum]
MTVEITLYYLSENVSIHDPENVCAQDEPSNSEAAQKASCTKCGSRLWTKNIIAPHMSRFTLIPIEVLGLDPSNLGGREHHMKRLVDY